MTTTRKNISILLVDDSPEDREVYREYLGALDAYSCSVLEADEAEEALAVCRSVDLDCILLDYHLPSMDGLQFLAALHKVTPSHASALPAIVMVTGRGSERVAVDAMKHGAADYIVKSNLGEENLHRAIVNAVKKRDLAALLRRQEDERRRFEIELRQHQERLRLIMDGAKDYGILMLDTQGIVRNWSTGAREIFGYHESEAIGIHFHKLFTAEDNAQGVADMELSRARTEGCADDERWHVRADGSRFWGSGTVRPLRDEVGVFRGYVKVLKDLTERKVFEQNLRAAIDSHDQFLRLAADQLRRPVDELKAHTIAALATFVSDGGADANGLRETFERYQVLVERLEGSLSDIFQGKS